VKGAYDEACEGVDWIAHIASPFVFGEQLDLEML